MAELRAHENMRGVGVSDCCVSSPKSSLDLPFVCDLARSRPAPSRGERLDHGSIQAKPSDFKPTNGTGSSSSLQRAARRHDRFRRVEIEAGCGSELDIDDRHAGPLDNVPCSDVANEFADVTKGAFRQDGRVAGLTVGDGAPSRAKARISPASSVRTAGCGTGNSSSALSKVLLRRRRDELLSSAACFVSAPVAIAIDAVALALPGAAYQVAHNSTGHSADSRAAPAVTHNASDDGAGSRTDCGRSLCLSAGRKGTNHSNGNDKLSHAFTPLLDINLDVSPLCILSVRPSIYATLAIVDSVDSHRRKGLSRVVAQPTPGRDWNGLDGADPRAVPALLNICALSSLPTASFLQRRECPSGQ